MQTTTQPTRSTLALIIGMMIFASLASEAKPDFPTRQPAWQSPPSGAQFAQDNPTFAKRIHDVDQIYDDTQVAQDFFLACGGFGQPAFGCGLASDFYDQLANRYHLPQQEVENPAQFRGPAVAARDKIESFLKDFKVKDKVCVSVHLPFKTIKKCITVSFPGSLDHFLDKVPDFPGTHELKKKVRKAFDRAKKEYQKTTAPLLRELDTLNDLIHRLDLVQQAIAAEDKKVQDKAMAAAAKALGNAIEPKMKPFFEAAARTAAKYFGALDDGYLRSRVDMMLALAREGVDSPSFASNSQLLMRAVNQKIAAAADPIEVMALDVDAKVYWLGAECVGTAPTAEAAKACVLEQFTEVLLALSEDLVHSIYTHASERLLYAPCSAQLADEVTTEAAADTFGISCAGYKTLQVNIQNLIERAGNDLYDQTIAPLVNTVIEKELRPTAGAMAKRVIQTIPLPSFIFPGQHNTPVQVKTCERSAGRFALTQNTCIVPLVPRYIYDWQEAQLTCEVKYGASLCTKDQVAEGQRGGFSFCAYSWTSTFVSNTEAYQVTPMAYDAQGCPAKGLNALVSPMSKALSGLCCVPIAP